MIDEAGVEWSDIATSPQQGILVAAGRLNGTSFCRVYLREAEPSRAQVDLEQAQVLGAALGAPNFHESIGGRDVSGWHRRMGREWRAVHLWGADASAGQRDRTPIMVEVTRAAT